LRIDRQKNGHAELIRVAVFFFAEEFGEFLQKLCVTFR
jgi:hypothetical protein